MITPVNERTYEFRGLSSDVKPTKKDRPLLGNGSVFVEMDTLKVFLYDEEHDKWIDWTTGPTIPSPQNGN